MSRVTCFLATVTPMDETGAQVRGRAAMKVISSNVSVNGFKKEIVIEKTTFVILYCFLTFFFILSCNSSLFALLFIIVYCHSLMLVGACSIS